MLLNLKGYRWILVAVMCLLVGCGNDRRNPVPSYPVYLDLDIQAEFPHFVPGNGFQTLIFRERRYEREYIGYGGIVVVVGMDGKYHAMDMACPLCLDRDTVVSVEGIYCTCPHCGEQYDVSYGLGVPMKGKSKWPLRDYKCFPDGGHLIIRN